MRYLRRLRPMLASAGIALAAGFVCLPPAGAISMGSMPATATVGAITVADGFARAMPAGVSNGGGYLSITNRGTDPDRLLTLSSPSSREVEVHELLTSGGTMQMRALAEPLVIPPGRSVALQPGGNLHLMFVGVTQPFVEGSEVALTLTFEKAGKIALKLPVLTSTMETLPNDGRPSQP